MVCGIKDASYHGFSPSQEKFIPLLQAYFKKQSIVSIVTTVLGGKIGIVYAKTQDSIDKLCLYLENIERYNTDFGKIVGYPNCCFFEEAVVVHQEKIDIILKTLQQSKTLYRQLNSVYNFNGRGDLIKDIENQYHITTDAFSLISHIPCSFDCQESLKKAHILEAVFSRYDPEYLYTIQEKSQNLYLYFGPTNRIALKQHGNTFSKNDIYEGIITDSGLEKIIEKTSTFLLKNNILFCYSETGDLFSTYFVGKDCWVMDFRN